MFFEFLQYKNTLRFSLFEKKKRSKTKIINVFQTKK